MKRLLPFLFALSASLIWAQGPTGHERRYELSPDPNWPLDIELGSGEYKIVASLSDKIAVTYEGEETESRGDVQVQISSGHGQNYLKIACPKSNFHAVIEVPHKSNLRVRMGTGALRVGDIEGNKDIEIVAGNLELNSVRPQDYARTDFSVRIGGVNAPIFTNVKSGLWRSFKTLGPGKYRLHAHVGVGDLTLQANTI
jgi:hypothetical protein